MLHLTWRVKVPCVVFIRRNRRPPEGRSLYARSLKKDRMAQWLRVHCLFCHLLPVKPGASILTSPISQFLICTTGDAVNGT